MAISDNNDIKIQDGHIVLVNGDFVEVNAVDRIIQQISVGLKILLGDWVLDENAGVNYFGGFRMYPEILSAQIKNAINSVEGVDTILKYQFYIDRNNIYHVSATVKIGNSEILINEEISPKSLKDKGV